MILDKEGQFSSAQVLTVTAASTNILNLGPKKVGTANGGEVEILLSVATTFTAAGAATLTVQLRTSDNANMSSPTIVDVSDALAVAELVSGAKVRFEPRLGITLKKYNDLNYVVATGPFTAGAISAAVVAGRQTNV